MFLLRHWKRFSEAETICFDYNRGPRKEFQTYLTSLCQRAARFGDFASTRSPKREWPCATWLLTDPQGGNQSSKRLGRTIYPLNGVSFTLENETLIADLSAHDPNFMLSDDVNGGTPGTAAWCPIPPLSL